MNTFTIEHWREGEMIETFTVTKDGLRRAGDQVFVVIPPATITLNTDDELRFSPQDAINFLSGK